VLKGICISAFAVYYILLAADVNVVGAVTFSAGPAKGEDTAGIVEEFR